jgi:hypothetical protein
MKDDYLMQVSVPMDFSTVENKLKNYFSMTEFRDDLSMIFSNCVSYNGVNHEFGQYARSIWNQLNQVFQDACAVEGVSLEYVSPKKGVNTRR